MARTHRDLVTWQLANRLRRRIRTFTSRQPAAKDIDYCRQIRKAIASACNNTSEGFYKYKHPPFANSVRIARGELGEVRDQLDDGRDQGYLGPTEYEELSDLCTQALKTNAGLLNYLEGNSKKKPGEENPGAEDL